MSTLRTSATSGSASTARPRRVTERFRPVLWLRSVKENGLPTLAHLTLIRHTKEIHIRITTKRLYYKVRDVEPTTTQNLSVLCSQWSREHLSRTQGYQLLRLPDGLGNAQDVPLIIPLAMLGAIEAGKPPVEGLDAPVDLPLFGPNMIWLAPIRTKPRRTYDDVRLQYSPEGSHTPYLIRKLFQSHQDAQKFKTMIEEVGENSSLYESIAIKPFGRGETAPFELDIVLDGKRLNLNNVGYGVSQSFAGDRRNPCSGPRAEFCYSAARSTLAPEGTSSSR